MASEYPYFRFWVKDFLGDIKVASMNTEQIGAYLLLLLHAWQDEPPATLPNDEAILARLARLSADGWNAVRTLVLACFTPTPDGKRLLQKRLRKEWEHASGISAKRSRAGQKSQASRRGFLYAFQKHKDGTVKIGSSVDPHDRFSKFSTYCSMLGTWSVPNMQEAERFVHDHFAKERLKGEWFRISEKQVLGIGTLLQQMSNKCSTNAQQSESICSTSGATNTQHPGYGYGSGISSSERGVQGREGQPQERRPYDQTNWFWDVFWPRWPDGFRQGGQAALMAVRVLDPSPDVRQLMLDQLELWKRSLRWRNGRVNNAAAWISEEMFRDEPPLENLPNANGPPEETESQRQRRLDKQKADLDALDRVEGVPYVFRDRRKGTQ